MFVDIENFKSVIGVENLLMPYTKGRVLNGRRQQKEHITPDVCMQILKSTNAPLNIQHMLECIKELPPSEQAQFKDVVLATFDQREQPNKQPYNIVLLGKKLAAASGYEEELAEAQKLKDGDFLLSSSKCDKGFVCFNNAFQNIDFSAYEKFICLSDAKIQFLEGVKFSKILEFPNSSDVSFFNEVSRVGCDFTGVQCVRFKDGAKVDLGAAQNLPPDIDVSMCSDVTLADCDLKDQPNLRFKEGAKVLLDGNQNIPAHLDISMCQSVYIYNCDLKDKINIRFKDGARVLLYNAQNLIPDMDFSQCSDVTLADCDLKDQQHLCFRDGAKVDLRDIDNLPTNLDFSQCSEVTLAGCDLKNQPHLRFQNGAKVELRCVDNLSSNVDFSVCSEVELFGRDLYVVSPLVFREGAKVRLNFANVQSPQIDFSKCAELTLNLCDFKNVECLIFKNREQMKASEFQRPDKWKGKLIFIDEQELLQAGKEIDMKKNVSAKVEDARHGADEKSSSGNRWGKFVDKIFGNGRR